MNKKFNIFIRSRSNQFPVALWAEENILRKTLVLPWSYLGPTLVLSGERGQAPSLCRSMSSSWLLQQPEKYVLYFYILLFIFNFSFYIYVHVLLLFRIYIFCFTSACLAETISPLLLNSPESTVLKNKKNICIMACKIKSKSKCPGALINFNLQSG